MALTTSIYLDDEDLRSTYGIEILAVDDPWGTARFASSLLDVPLRDGSILTRGKYEPRRIILKGYIKHSSHQALMGVVDILKRKIQPQGEGLQQFRLTFTDAYIPRWFRGYFENIKLGPPYQPWRISVAINIELTFVCTDAFADGDDMRFSSLMTEAAGTFNLKFNNSIGSAISYPLIELYAGTATEVTIVNTAVLHREKTITPTLSAVCKRIYGNPEWSGAGLTTWGALLSQVIDSTSVRIPTAGNFTPRAFTVLMWIYRTFADGSNDEYFFMCNNDESFKIWRDGNGLNSNINFTLDAITVSVAQSNLPLETWTPLIATYDGDDIILCVGSAANSVEMTDFDTVGTYLYVGCDSSSAKQAHSRLDEVRLLNRGFGSYEITEWKEMDSPIPMHKGTLAYFKFDEDAIARGWKNSSLTITNLETGHRHFLDSEKMTALKAGSASFESMTDVIANVSGEFPYILPGINNFLITSDGIFTLFIQHRPRYL